MRGTVFLFVVILLAVILEAPNSFSQELRGEKAHLNPDVVTIWHKLGIPQGVQRSKLFKDSLINRKGLKPEKERKPKLLRLTDPANLEEGKPEMLKVAAKMKMDADLAPQKIKALKYISSVGCSCYNKQTAGLVEKAIVEGMKDCSLDVRIAAMNVVLANVGNQCSVQGQCGTCCSEGIVKALKEIAYKTDDTGCYLEPNEQVRNLAERAMCLCPPLIEKAEEPEPVKPPVVPDPDLIDKGKGDEDKSDADPTDNGKKPDDGDDDETDPLDEDELKKKKTNGDTTGRYSSAFQNVSSRTSYGRAWNDPALSELQIRGVVDDVQQDGSDVWIELVKPYRIPNGSQLVIALDEDHVSFGTVISSRAGSAVIKVDDDNVVRNLTNSTRVRLGILE